MHNFMLSYFKIVRLLLAGLILPAPAYSLIVIRDTLYFEYLIVSVGVAILIMADKFWNKQYRQIYLDFQCLKSG